MLLQLFIKDLRKSIPHYIKDSSDDLYPTCKMGRLDVTE